MNCCIANKILTYRAHLMTRRVPYSLGVFQICQLAASLAGQYIADANIPMYPFQFFKEFQSCAAGTFEDHGLINSVATHQRQCQQEPSSHQKAF